MLHTVMVEFWMFLLFCNTIVLHTFAHLMLYFSLRCFCTKSEIFEFCISCALPAILHSCTFNCAVSWLYSQCNENCRVSSLAPLHDLFRDFLLLLLSFGSSYVYTTLQNYQSDRRFITFPVFNASIMSLICVQLLTNFNLQAGTGEGAERLFVPNVSDLLPF